MDIGARFRMAFELLFYCWSVSLVLGVVSHMVPWAAMRNTLHIIMTLISYVIYIAVIFLYYSRFKHSGSVCCGDYLTADQLED